VILQMVEATSRVGQYDDNGPVGIVFLQDRREVLKPSSDEMNFQLIGRHAMPLLPTQLESS